MVPLGQFITKPTFWQEVRGKAVAGQQPGFRYRMMVEGCAQCVWIMHGRDAALPLFWSEQVEKQYWG
jgi:hypothetical protein